MSKSIETERTSLPSSLWRPTSAASFAMVSIGAALWGTDPLFRQWLALALPAPVIVLVEHLLPALLLAPFALRGLRQARRTFTAGDWVSLVFVGCGASALATLLFTQAFTYGVPTTPILLQQIQPLFALVGARVLLGERLQRRFGLYFVFAMTGAYLVAFPNPLDISLRGWMPALLAISAAGLWGMGTVLGRRLGAKLPFEELTALRLLFGLLAAVLVVVFEGDGRILFHLGAKSFFALVLLALVPGLMALLIYYRGLRGTPASAATLGELAFPLTALLVDYLAFHSVLSASQWFGALVLAGTMIAMGLVRANGTPTGVEVPQLRSTETLLTGAQ
jgi:DME family drug/metabolite transporter